MFDENFVALDNPIFIMKNWVGWIQSANGMKILTLPVQCNSVQCGREERLVRRVPPHDWIKVNTDDVVCRKSGRAMCDVLLRDSDGKWCRGFPRKLSEGGVLVA